MFFIDADGKPHIEITQYVGDLISNLLDRIALKMLIGEKDEAKAYALKLADIVDAMISQVETGSAIGILKDHVEAAQKTETYNLMKEAWYANKDKLLAEQTEDTLKPIQDALLKYKKEVSNTYTYSESYPAAADALAKRLAEMQTIPPAQAETSVAIAPTVSEKVPKTNSRDTYRCAT